MDRQCKRLTKTELIKWLEAEVSVGHIVTVSPDDFDIRDIILETHFEVDRSDHLAYRLVVDRIKDGTWVWSNDTPPEIRYEVSVCGVRFALETTFFRGQDGPQMTWEVVGIIREDDDFEIQLGKRLA